MEQKDENVSFDYRDQNVSNDHAVDAGWENPAKFRIKLSSSEAAVPPPPDSDDMVIFADSSFDVPLVDETAPYVVTPPVAEDPSRQSRRGCLIAAVIVMITLVLSVAVIVGVLVFGAISEDRDMEMLADELVREGEEDRLMMYETATATGPVAYALDAIDDRGRPYTLLACPVNVPSNPHLYDFRPVLVPDVREGGDYRYDDIVDSERYQIEEDLEDNAQLYASKLFELDYEWMDEERTEVEDVTVWVGYKVPAREFSTAPVVLMLTSTPLYLTEGPEEFRFIEYPEVVTMTADEFEAFAKERLLNERN